MSITELAIKYGDKTFYKKNEGLYVNAGLFYIIRGTIKLLYVQTKNRMIAVDIFQKGEFITSESNMKLVFLEDSELVFLDKEIIHTYSDMDNHLGESLIKIIGKSRQNTVIRLSMLVMLKKNESILHVLYYLAIKFGKVLSNGKIMLNLKLTEMDFKELCNTTRENVSRTFNNLKRDGLLERVDGHLVISSTDDLNNRIIYNYYDEFLMNN